MSIGLHFKNFCKLLLIGAVLFSASLALSASVSKENEAKNSQICADGAQNAYLNASKQTRLESPDFLLVDDSCVRASAPPITVTTKVMGALAGGDEYYQQNLKMEDDQKAILEYIVEQGDTAAGIAQKFNISSDTLLWANDLTQSSQIKPGQKLVVPPVTGVIHNVVNGDTISALAVKYQVKTADILAFNELSGEEDIYIGDTVIVPGGKMPKAVAKSKTATKAKPNSGLVNGLSLPGDYFMCPINMPCRKTQGLHYNNAVDLSNGKCGDPIYAAASGIVQRAAYGWNKGAGNYITILHPSGAVTKYFHLQTIFVSSGQAVSKGQNIALMGTTGLSTGCHLHFEVNGASNPLR
jgi:murein DD-endopeptidase MepM/ murein hydrolase activator NlpD